MSDNNNQNHKDLKKTESTEPAPEAVVESTEPAPEAVVESTEPAPEAVVESTEPAPEAVVESTEPAPEAVVESEAVVEEKEPIIITEESFEKDEEPTSDYLVAVSESEHSSRISFEEFTDEKLLVSHDAFGNKQMKIKVLEVSDENPPSKWKFGDRVKVSKILVTIKHLTTQEVEEGEFDIEAIERELAEKRHYTSTNRWIPANDIKNGYVVGSRHTTLISDASALDYIVF